MPVPQPIAALVKIFELEGTRPRGNAAAAGKDLRELLAKPVAPLAALTPAQRDTITAQKLERFAAALDEAQPEWLYDYAAAAVVQLPANEKRLRRFMLQLLFKDEANTASALSALAGQIAALPAVQRRKSLNALFGHLNALAELRSTQPAEEFERAFMALVAAANPPQKSSTFARAALPMLRVLGRLIPGASFPEPADDRDPVSQLLPLFEPPCQAFLLRDSWGTFAEEINAALWDELWRHARNAAPVRAAPPPPQAAAAAPGQGALHQHLIKEAAWAEADAAIGRALQDTGFLTRSFDRLDAAAEGDAAARAKVAKGASNLILQWVRQAARYRDIAPQGAAGDRVEFDPVFHDSDEAMPGEMVRIVKPPIVRSVGNKQIVLLRGEVELD